MAMQVAACPVCLESFSSQHPHRPKILLCGHTTCESCIHQWTNRSNPPLVQCPHCRRQFDGLALDDVPVNFGMVELIENMKAMLDEWMVKKRNAEEAGSRSSSRNEITGAATTTTTQTCGEHSDLALTIYCWDCRKAVCDRCALFSHKTHSYSEIHQAADRMKQQVADQTREMEEWINRRKRLNEQIRKKMAAIATKKEEIARMTDRICDEMVEALEEWRRSTKQRSIENDRRDELRFQRVFERLEEEIREGQKMQEENEALTISKDGSNLIGFLHCGGETCFEHRRRMDERTKRGEEENVFARISEAIRESTVSTTTAAVATIAASSQQGKMVIDSEKMVEAKMLMEEGMRRVAIAAGYWTDESGSDWCQEEERFAKRCDTSSSSNSKERKEKIDRIRKMIKKGLEGPVVSVKIDGHIECETTTLGVAWWSNDGGESLYVSGSRTGGIRQIDAKAGQVLRTIGDDVKNPGCIAVSREGDIFVIDKKTQIVNVVSGSSGKIVQRIGSKKGGEGDGQFSTPYCICIVDAWNEVFISDSDNGRIQVFDKRDGQFIRKFGSRGKEQGQLQDPTGVAVDASRGFIFVCDCNNHRIQVFDREGSFLWLFGSRGDGDGQLCAPHGIVADWKRRQLVVADKGNHRLCVFTYEGLFIGTTMRVAGLEKPLFLSMWEDGRLAVSSSGHHGVFFGEICDDAI